MKSRKKNIIKISLDILMTLIFALLMNRMLGGQTVHEIAGLAIGAFFVVHSILNKEWIKGVTKKFTSKKLPVRTRAEYIVNVLLLIAIAVIIITGILMSRVVFAKILFVHANVQGLHKAMSYIALLLIGVHVGLVWTKVVNTLKKLFVIPNSKVIVTAATIAAMAIFVVGSYNIYSTDYLNNVAAITSSITDIQTGNQKFGGGATSDSLFKIPSEGSSTDGVALTSERAATENKIISGTGDAGGKMNGQGNQKDSSSGLFSTLFKNISIMAAFSVLTYYVDKLLCRKRKPQAAA